MKKMKKMKTIKIRQANVELQKKRVTPIAIVTTDVVINMRARDSDKIPKKLKEVPGILK
jgi:hypothetical protein